MFYCDPPGTSKPENLFNSTVHDQQLNYIFFHDQEPIHLDIHKDLFSSVSLRNNDIVGKHRAIVTSEYDSEYVDQVCSLYNWTPYYYFFHGWAAIDWYRGYDKTFLVTPPEEREIKYSFINPNRIVAGKRDHRSLLQYWLRKQGVKNDLSSFPEVCPAENIPVIDVVSKYVEKYPDIVELFSKLDLPWHMPNENDHPMHSCWLSLFDESASSLIYVVSETVFWGKRHHLTEKIFKPICMQMPFVLLSSAGSLEYLKRYDFKTFNHIWDESYDQETDDFKRIEKVATLLKSFDDMSHREHQQILKHCEPVIDYNHRHFYKGRFESILWKELTGMLHQMQEDFK